MSGTLNKVMLIGHTGDEIKMHYFEGGGCIGRFPLATNESYTNRTTGERVTNTEWHNIVVRNKAAEICEKYLKKGDKIYIEGRLKTRKWQDEQGRERHSKIRPLKRLQQQRYLPRLWTPLEITKKMTFLFDIKLKTLFWI
jgi:single-strand DNA-binding protein